MMAQRSPSDSVIVLSAHQRISIPLAQSMMDKIMAELDDPNWLFVTAFMAYMDPGDEYFAVHAWSSS